MLKNKIINIVTLIVFSSAFVSIANAENYDVVKDSNNNIVKNTFDNCVLTKWVSKDNKCAAPQIPPAADVVQTIEPQPKKPIKRAKSYLVFFDYNKSVLTPSAIEVIKKANNEAHAGTSDAYFTLNGHTDTSGSYDYNLKLSQRRVGSVKGELVKLGNNSDNIQTYAKSETELLVSTKDGVKEGQNRRVEIMYFVEE